MKTAITSILSIALGIAIGYLIAPKPPSSEVAKGDTQTPGPAKEELVQGKWFCRSASGWTGVYELLPGGVLKGYPTKGGEVTGTWTIQTSLRFHHQNGAQDNFDLPNSDGAILGISNGGNKLSMARTK